jgi:glycosyltransferase involved in cell wall biosynthesis
MYAIKNLGVSLNMYRKQISGGFTSSEKIKNIDRFKSKEVFMPNKTSKKAVLHISHTDIRADSRILKELATHQESGSYRVFAIGVSASDENPPVENNPDIEIDSCNLIFNKTKWRPRALRHFLILLEFSLRILRRSIRFSPDVVHCHDTLVLPIGFIVKFITGAKLVYDAHELESNKNGQSKLIARATLLVEKFCWNSVDLLVSVSPSILVWYEKNLGKKTHVLVLNSPVFDSKSTEADVCEPKGRYFHERFAIPEDSKVFIYLGILADGRGIELILDAFSNGSISSHVIFMGYGDLSDMIDQRSGRNKNIHLHPPVKHDQVVRLTKSADVGLCLIQNVSLSDYYCLPNKLFEYFFAGIPVLASDFPDISQAVAKHSLGKCCKLDSKSIYEAIKEFENLKDLPKINTGDLYDFSWGAQETKLIKEYDELMK